MTESEGLRVMAMLRGVWPRQGIDNDAVPIWAALLSDLAYADVTAAVTRLAKTSKWLPTVAEIRAEVVEGRLTLPPAENAWRLVLDAVSRFGAYRVPEFEHGEVKAAVDDIGWKAICLDENVAATRARWIDAYRSRRNKRVELEVTGRYVEPERRLEGDPTAIGKLLEGRFPSRRGT